MHSPSPSLSSSRRHAIFLNCHKDFGGAERRFARTFCDHLCNDKNITLITNKASVKALMSAGIIKTKEGITEMPGGIIEPGLTYKFYHIINFILLTFYALKNRVKHIHYPVDPSPYSLFHCVFLRLLGISYSLSIVDSSRTKPSDFGFFRKLIWKYSIKYAQGIEFLSDGIRKNISCIFSAQMSPSQKTSVSPCSFTDYSKAHFSYEKNYDLVMVCRLHPKKGHDLLFSALQHIKELGKSHEVSSIGIFGSGSLETQIRAEIDKLKEFNISLRKTNDPFAVFAKSKFLLSLQTDENYPSQAILEALSSGAGIIATDVGETYKIVPDKVGFRVPHSAVDLAKTILHALGTYKVDYSKFRLLNEFVTTEHSAERFSLYLREFILESAGQDS